MITVKKPYLYYYKQGAWSISIGVGTLQGMRTLRWASAIAILSQILGAKF